MNPNLNSKIDELIPTLEELFKDKMEEKHLAGLCVGIYHKGEIKYCKGFGFANIEEKKPITRSTIFQIGSISKTMAGIALMQQWEQGKFKLDDDVNEYMPLDRVGRVGYKKKDKRQDLKESVPKVTFRRLLTHTAGIGEIMRYSDIFQIRTGMYYINPMNDPILPLEDKFKKDIPCYVMPGAKWSYANHGIDILGYITEQLSDNKDNFHDYVLEHIFSPLGMDHTDAIWSDRIKPDLASGYKFKKRNKENPFKESKFRRSWGRPCGGIYSSMDDMLKYAKFLIEKGKINGNRIIKEETLADMLSSQYSLDERVESHGLIFHLYSLNGHKLAWHGGQTIAFNSAMHFAPDDDFALLMFSNTTNSSRPIYDISRKILWKIFNTPIEKITDKSFPDGSRLDTRNKDFLKKLTGTYCPLPGFLTNTRILTGPGFYKVEIKGSQLILKSKYGNKKKGVIIRPADLSDQLLFESNECLNNGTIEPHERILFVFNKKKDGKAEKIILGLNEFTRKNGIYQIKTRLQAFFGRILGGIL